MLYYTYGVNICYVHIKLKKTPLLEPQNKHFNYTVHSIYKTLHKISRISTYSQNELFPTKTVQQRRPPVAVRCRTFVSGLIGMFVFGTLQKSYRVHCTNLHPLGYGPDGAVLPLPSGCRFWRWRQRVTSNCWCSASRLCADAFYKSVNCQSWLTGSNSLSSWYARKYPTAFPSFLLLLLHYYWCHCLYEDTC
jgi:hypothetical protein